MAKKTFQGRPVVAGKVQGNAMVSKQPFNPTSSYIENLWGGASDNAICTDQDNKELYKKELNGVVLCTSQCIGSSMGGGAFMAVNGLGVPPKAMLFSLHIDAVSASGVVMANVWQDKPIITIDQLGNEFLEAVKTGDLVSISEDGTVEIG